MRSSRRLLLVCSAVLGAAVVVLPAVAGSETGPTVTAINSEGVYKEQRHYWSPATVTVGSGGVVSFSNPSAEVRHGLEWTGGPAAPSCGGLPPTGLGATSWHAECTFGQAGTYTFRCSVHPIEMTGTVTVNANGTTTTTTNAPPPPPGGQGGSTPAGASEPPGSPLVGGAAQALLLGHGQRGTFVRGSIRVSPAGARSRLQVDLLARRASLVASHGVQVRVGRLVRSGLAPGTVSFKVGLTAAARRALRTHRRLAVEVRVLLTPVHGTSVRITREVVLHV